MWVWHLYKGTQSDRNVNKLKKEKPGVDDGEGEEGDDDGDELAVPLASEVVDMTL